MRTPRAQRTCMVCGIRTDWAELCIGGANKDNRITYVCKKGCLSILLAQQAIERMSWEGG